MEEREEFEPAAPLLLAESAVALAEGLLLVRNRQGKLVDLAANPAQRLFEKRRGQENIVLKARQMGLSTWIAGRFLLKTILVPGTVTVQVAHTKDAAVMLFRTMQRMWENLPEAMRAANAKQGRSNKSEMSFPAIDSEIRIVSAGEPNAGRGMTVTNLHCSEVSRWQGDAAETLAGLRAALVPDGELVLESTPNGAYGCFYNEWRTAERRGAVRHFFPWWMEPAYVAGAAADLTEEEMALVAGHGLSLEQVGFRRELRERFGPLAAQEFAEDAASCFRESGSCAFEASVLTERLAGVLAPLERRWDGALLVWMPPMAGRQYVMAADPAGGGAEGDFCTAQIVDASTGVQCAEIQARWAPRLFAGRLAEVAREFNGALVVVERNNHGGAVLGFLEDALRLRLYADKDGKPGFLTSSRSRPEMLAGLGTLLSTRPQLFASARLLEECRSFLLKDGGRMEAAGGAHDDLVLAMAIAHAVRKERFGGL